MNTMTLGKKIGLGFAAQIALAAILGGVAIVNMKSAGNAAKTLSTEFVPETEIASQMVHSMSKAQLAVRSYGYTAEPNYLADAKTNLEGARKHLQEARALAEQHPTLVKLKEEVAKLDPLLKEFERLVQQTEVKNKEIVASRDKLNKAAQGFLTNIDKLIAHQKEVMAEEIKSFAAADKLKERLHKLSLAIEIRGEGNAARIAVFKSQALRDPKVIEEGLKNFEIMEKNFEELTPLVKLAQDIAELNEVKKDAREYAATMKEIMAEYLALADIGKKRAEAGKTIEELAEHVSATGMKRTVEAAGQSSEQLGLASWIISVGLVVVLAVAITIAFFIIRGTTRILTRLANTLAEGADQTASAAGQVSAASQSLAEGASEQAASLEETSASLEEMSSMTKRNADNSDKVNELARQARTAADTGASDMQVMSKAMQDIKASSDDISKIIKTIDEIAFQTNILALNAAVEAARAGEAGMGFAVVADEVRNLAQRAAQAAKETAGKIEGAITKTGQGVQISDKVGKSLQEIVSKIRQVDELAAEVATASKEQSQGITQVNTAVTQMDKVTQSNASNAEESASAAEELNAQADALKEAVGDLLKLVGGAAGSAARQSAKPAVKEHKIEVKKQPIAPAVARDTTVKVTAGGNGGKGRAPAKAAGPALHHELAASQVGAGSGDIPMEGEFKRF